MTALPQTLSGFGFDVPKLSYAFRTELAACAALLVAWLLGLEHPQWSAMTVWAAAQPTRGQLVEKSLFRMAGTLSGTIMGVLLMVVSRGDPLILTLGLAGWIAACAGIGNLQRGFVSYGTILAGYSASMVALLDSAHPDHVLMLGFDRLMTILVGVLMALVVGLIFTPKAAEGELTGRVRRLTARVLRAVAGSLSSPPRDEDAGRLQPHERDILIEMSAIEDMLEPHGAGSLRSRRTVHAIRALLMAQVSLLLAARRPRPSAASEGKTGALAAELLEEAKILEGGASRARSRAALDRLAALTTTSTATGEPRAAPVAAPLAESLARMAQALADYSGDAPARQRGAQAPAPVVLHRDWAGAWRAFVRAGLMMLAVGLFWVASGWSAGPFLLLGVSIMTSLFSTFDNPVRVMRSVFIGQIYGALGALACRFLAWPLAGSEMEVVLFTMPFILLASLFFSHKRTQLAAFDYAMVSLLLLQPVYPLTGSLAGMLAGALAVITAPLIAMAAYRFVFPLDVPCRITMLAGMMIHEVEGMARAADPDAHREVWRGRLYHRLLRLARLSGQLAGPEDTRRAALDGGASVLALGTAIFTLHDLEKRPDLPAGAARALRVARGRLATIGKDPDKAAAALAIAAARIKPALDPAAETLAQGARALCANADFFRQVR